MYLIPSPRFKQGLNSDDDSKPLDTGIQLISDQALGQVKKLSQGIGGVGV